MHNYKELKVWQKSRSLVKQVYLVSADFPPEEKFGITSQIRRAAISIPTNISEGCGRNSNPELLRFFDFAYTSACEVENLLILAFDLEYISKEILNNLSGQIQEVQKMIFGLKNKLNNQLVHEPLEKYERLDTSI